eukprot:532774-Karenia_brevis.AAC.1
MQEEEEYRKMIQKARRGEDGSIEALPAEGDAPGKEVGSANPSPSTPALTPAPAGVKLPEVVQDPSQ